MSASRVTSAMTAAPAAGGGDLRGDRVEAIGAPRADRDAGAVARQPERGRAADAGRGAGDRDDTRFAIGVSLLRTATSESIMAGKLCGWIPPSALLRELVAVNSVNPTLVPARRASATIAELVAHECGAAGSTCPSKRSPTAGRTWSACSKAAPRAATLMFCGHTDTVGVAGMSDPFTPVERDGRLYGRGAQDMKGGVAAMIGGGDRHRRSAAGLPPAASSSPRSSTKSTRASAPTRWCSDWRADAAVVTEPTDLAIAIGHKGFAWVEVDSAREGGARQPPGRRTGCDPAAGPRALRGSKRSIATLQARPPHPLVGTGSLHASIIAGGRELSSYPDRARCRWSAGRCPASRGDRAREVQEILDALAREDATFRASARTMFSRPAYEVAADTSSRGCSAPRWRKSAERRVHRRELLDRRGRARPRGHSVGAVRPGGAGLHSTEEYVHVAEVMTCRDALVELARRFCRC